MHDDRKAKGKGEVLGKEGLISVYAQKGETEKALKMLQEDAPIRQKALKSLWAFDRSQLNGTKSQRNAVLLPEIAHKRTIRVGRPELNIDSRDGLGYIHIPSPVEHNTFSS